MRARGSRRRVTMAGLRQVSPSRVISNDSWSAPARVPENVHCRRRSSTRVDDDRRGERKGACHGSRVREGPGPLPAMCRVCPPIVLVPRSAADTPNVGGVEKRLVVDPPDVHEVDASVADRAPESSSSSMPRSAARWLSVPAGMTASGTASSLETAAVASVVRGAEASGVRDRRRWRKRMPMPNAPRERTFTSECGRDGEFPAPRQGPAAVGRRATDRRARYRLAHGCHDVTPSTGRRPGDPS